MTVEFSLSWIATISIHTNRGHRSSIWKRRPLEIVRFEAVNGREEVFFPEIFYLDAVTWKKILRHFFPRRSYAAVDFHKNVRKISQMLRYCFYEETNLNTKWRNVISNSVEFLCEELYMSKCYQCIKLSRWLKYMFHLQIQYLHPLFSEHFVINVL